MTITDEPVKTSKAPGEKLCVKRTRCCASEGGKNAGGACCVCGECNPVMIWVDPEDTKFVTSTEPREYHRPARFSKTTGYVPRSAHNPSTSRAGGRSSGTGPDSFDLN